MFLRVPGVKTWREAILLGVIDEGALSRPTTVWPSQGGAFWVTWGDPAGSENPPSGSLASLVPNKTNLLEQLGIQVRQNPPVGKPRHLDALWCLFGPQPQGEMPRGAFPSLAPTPAVYNRVVAPPVVLRFPSVEAALPFVREILQGMAPGQLTHALAGGLYWLKASGLSRFHRLGLVQAGEEGAVSFRRSASGLWVEEGFVHPLEDRLRFGDNALILVDSANRLISLDPGAFHPVEASVNWCWEPTTKWTGETLEGRFPLILTPGLVPESRSEVDSVPDLWIVKSEELPNLQAWLMEVTPEVREAFRFGVVKGSAGVVRFLLLRFREVSWVNLGAIPGHPFARSSLVGGLTLPWKTRLEPNPGPLILRRLLGLNEPGRMAWVESGPDGVLLGNTFEDAVLGSWESIAQFGLETKLEVWRPWVKEFTFAWETLPLVDRSPPPGQLGGDYPAGPSPVDMRQVRSLFPESELEGANRPCPSPSKRPKKVSRSSEKPANPPATHTPPAQPLTLPLPGEKDSRPSMQWLERWGESSGSWVDAQRIEICRELARAWAKERQPAWAAKAWMMAASMDQSDPWDGPEGLSVLRFWHQSLAPRHGLGQEPGFSAALSQAGREEVQPERLAWLLTGVILESKSGKSPFLTVDSFHGLMKVVRQGGNQTSQRLLLAFWKELGRIQGDPLVVVRGLERQLVGLMEVGLQPREEWPGPLWMRLGNQAGSTNVGQILDHLENQIREWLKTVGQSETTCHTSAMVKWCFAYGFARLGEADRARELAQSASQGMRQGELSSLVSQAFQFRVEQAILGQGAMGPLPGDWLEKVARLGGVKAFPLDYTREFSQILEPHQAIHPFRGIVQKSKLEGISDPNQLGQACWEMGRALQDGPGASESWLEILDRILLVPGSHAVDILVWATRHITGLEANSADFARLGARLLVAHAFFQKSHDEFRDLWVKRVSNPALISSWAGGGSAPGMNRELFAFFQRRVGLLVHLEGTDSVKPLLDSLEKGIEAMPAHSLSSHLRFLQRAARLRFFPLEADATHWEELENALKQESTQLARFTQRRNEPWSTHCCKLISYVAALGAAGPGRMAAKVDEILRWLIPLKDHFATSPEQSSKQGEVLRYHRYQVEWIEALVLSVIGSVEPKTSAWLLADEDLIRTDLRKALREASALLGSGRGV